MRLSSFLPIAGASTTEDIRLRDDLKDARLVHRVALWVPESTHERLKSDSHLADLQGRLIKRVVESTTFDVLPLKDTDSRICALALLSECLRPDSSLPSQQREAVLKAVWTIINAELKDPKPRLTDFAITLSGLGEEGIPFVRHIADFEKNRMVSNFSSYSYEWYSILERASKMGASAADWIVADLQWMVQKTEPYDPEVSCLELRGASSGVPKIIDTLSSHWPREMLSLGINLQTETRNEVLLRYRILAPQIERVAEIAFLETTNAEAMPPAKIARLVETFELIDLHISKNTLAFPNRYPSIATLDFYLEGLTNLLALSAVAPKTTHEREPSADDKPKSVLETLTARFFSRPSASRLEQPETKKTASIVTGLLRGIRRCFSEYKSFAQDPEHFAQEREILALNEVAREFISCLYASSDESEAQAHVKKVADRFLDEVFPLLQKLANTDPSLATEELSVLEVGPTLRAASAIRDTDLDSIRRCLDSDDRWSRGIGLYALNGIDYFREEEELPLSEAALEDLANRLQKLSNDSYQQTADLAADRFLCVTKMRGEEALQIECGRLMMDPVSKNRSISFWNSLLLYSSKCLDLNENLANIGFEVCISIGNEYSHQNMEDWIRRSFNPEKLLWDSTRKLVRECLLRSEGRHYRCREIALILSRDFC
jgi:hypothetical protein